MDKVNTLMLSTASLGKRAKNLFESRSHALDCMYIDSVPFAEWEITVTLHQPGSPPVQSMTSRVAVKQVTDQSLDDAPLMPV